MEYLPCEWFTGLKRAKYGIKKDKAARVAGQPFIFFWLNGQPYRDVKLYIANISEGVGQRIWGLDDDLSEM